jgi:hypothetical protein
MATAARKAINRDASVFTEPAANSVTAGQSLTATAAQWTQRWRLALLRTAGPSPTATAEPS